MGKPSSSLKKKSSKTKSSSKARRRSKIKSKSRRNKSKKFWHHDKSLSSSDNDDSRSLVSLFSSSSEDNYRSRRAQSRTRKDVKVSKKRARRRSCSSESSDDSVHVRKRRRSKKNNDLKVRKKAYKKKKFSKGPSVSSMRSGSRSCSTCQGGSTSSDDSEVESHRGRSERKRKDKRKSEGVRGANERSRYRARSCSSCHHCSETDDHWSEEKHTTENNSRRLRSVVIVTSEVKEGGECELDRNEMKEELVYDHDYPCKSNDSNDGGGRRELDDNSLSASEKTVMVENEKGDVDVDFRFTTPKVQDSGKSCKGHCDRSNHKDDGVWINEPLESVEEKTSETSSVVGSLNIEDLESVLRQRALENLRKFRGGNQTNAKASNDKNKIGSDVKQLSIKKDELIQNGASSGAKCTEKNLILQGSGVPAVKGDPVSSSTNTRLLNENKGDSKSELAKHDFPSAPEQVTCAGNPNETIKRSIGYVNNNPNLNAPASIHRSSNSSPTLNPKPVAGLQEQLIVSESTIDNVLDANELDSATPKLSSWLRPLLRHNSSNKVKDEVKECSNFELKQTSTSQEPSTKLSVTEGGMDQQAVHTAQNVTQNIDNNGRVLDNLCDSAVHRSSCNVSTSGENEPNQGSQLEQKTMTVMRGGEMVQVSYKVYIPKKAPALSRRQLKR